MSRSSGVSWSVIATVNGVRFGELGTVIEKLLGDLIPSFIVAESQVDMRTGKIVDMELEEVSRHIRRGSINATAAGEATNPMSPSRQSSSTQKTAGIFVSITVPDVLL